MKRALISLLVGAGMLITPVAYAASAPMAPASTPLAPGGAAGVHNADLTKVPIYVWIGGALVIGGLAFALSGNGHNVQPAPAPPPPPPPPPTPSTGT